VSAVPSLIHRIERTPDGSSTLWSERYRQYYHSHHGAITQAKHVFLEGTATHLEPYPCVLEIGFGTGMNFLTTLLNTGLRGASLAYRSIEIDPLPAAVVTAVSATHPASGSPIWQQLLECWRLGPVLLKTDACFLSVDIADATLATLPPNWASAVYLDGFSPGANPELWRPQFIAKLALAMRPGALLATYSAAGNVRRALIDAGLIVTRMPGPPGKREFLRAQKP